MYSATCFLCSWDQHCAGHTCGKSPSYSSFSCSTPVLCTRATGSATTTGCMTSTIGTSTATTARRASWITSAVPTGCRRTQSRKLPEDAPCCCLMKVMCSAMQRGLGTGSGKRHSGRSVERHLIIRARGHQSAGFCRVFF